MYSNYSGDVDGYVYGNVDDDDADGDDDIDDADSDDDIDDDDNDDDDECSDCLKGCCQCSSGQTHSAGQSLHKFTKNEIILLKGLIRMMKVMGTPFSRNMFILLLRPMTAGRG